MRCFESLLTALCVLWATTAFATPSGSTRFTVEADGVLAVNGTKVFPVALTMAPASEAKSPDGRNALAALRADGVSFIRSGPTKGTWDNAAVEAEVKYEQAAARAGLYCMPYLRELASIGPKQQGRAAKLRELVDRLKDNPGLGVWKAPTNPNGASCRSNRSNVLGKSSAEKIRITPSGSCRPPAARSKPYAPTTRRTTSWAATSTRSATRPAFTP